MMAFAAAGRTAAAAHAFRHYATWHGGVVVASEKRQLAVLRPAPSPR
jgi:hypothetical protein